MEYDDLPEEIREKMHYYQLKQGNDYSAEVFRSGLMTGSAHGGFTWVVTDEGDPFWRDILKNGNIEVFYKKYPRVNMDDLFDDLDRRIEQMEKRLSPEEDVEIVPNVRTEEVTVASKKFTVHTIKL